MRLKLRVHAKDQTYARWKFLLVAQVEAVKGFLCEKRRGKSPFLSLLPFSQPVTVICSNKPPGKNPCMHTPCDHLSPVPPVTVETNEWFISSLLFIQWRSTWRYTTLHLGDPCPVFLPDFVLIHVSWRCIVLCLLSELSHKTRWPQHHLLCHLLHLTHGDSH